MPRLRWIATLVLILSGCGPTEREVGDLVMQVLGAVVLLGGGIQWLYALACRRLTALDVQFVWRPTLGLALFAAAASLLLALAGRLGDPDYLAIALAGVGPSYATYLLVSLRLLRESSWFGYATFIPFLLMMLPAAYLAAFGSTEAPANAWEDYFVLPGFLGLVSGPLLLLLFGELVLRRRRHASPPG